MKVSANGFAVKFRNLRRCIWNLIRNKASDANWWLSKNEVDRIGDYENKPIELSNEIFIRSSILFNPLAVVWTYFAAFFLHFVISN